MIDTKKAVNPAHPPTASNHAGLAPVYWPRSYYEDPRNRDGPLRHDIETYSPVDLTECGVYVYSRHPEFEILLCAFAYGDGPVEVIDLARGQPLPSWLADDLQNGKVTKSAYNAMFERTCWSAYFGRYIPPDGWVCTMIQAVSVSYPFSLEKCGEALGTDVQKDKRGKDLIKLFSVPHKRKVKQPDGSTAEELYRVLPEDAPEDWKVFKEYNRVDVETERSIANMLKDYPLEGHELELYESAESAEATETAESADPDANGDTSEGGPPAGSGTAEAGDGGTGKTSRKSNAWKRKLEYDNMGNLKGSMYNAMLIFHNDDKLRAIVFNELSESLEIRKLDEDCPDVPWSHPNEIWRDQDDSQLIAYLELNYGSFSERIYKNALAKIADDRRYHPIRDYLNALAPWDGVPRVDRLLVTTLGAADTPYVHAITRKMLCAAIARVMVPGTKFDTVVVMIGPQGTGKSTLVSKLAMKWFNDSLMLTDTKDKTAPEKLQGYWIHEISELAGLRKGDQETMKGFLSRQNDIFRPAYGRHSTPHKRQCIFVGTTNAEQGFLRDTTGNRRFWPVTVPGYAEDLPDTVPEDAASFHKHSWELKQEDIDQIWAEAYMYYKDGEPLVLPAELKEDAQKTQRESMETDDREPLVREYLEKLLPENWYNLEIPVRINYLTGGEFAGQKLVGTMQRQRVCNMEIWTECFGNTSSKIGRADSNQIIAMLERIPGWVRSPKKARVKPYGIVTVYVRDPDYVPEDDEVIDED